MRYFKLLFLLLPMVFVGCSESDDNTTPTVPPTAYDPNMTLVYDGETVGVFDVQATYDTDNRIYEFTAQLANGKKMSMRFCFFAYDQQGYEGVAYYTIANPDGTEAFSNLKGTGSDGSHYFFVERGFSGEDYIEFEYSGKIYADRENPDSDWHYVTGFSKLYISTISPGINGLFMESISNWTPWKTLDWKQNSAPGAPIELQYLGYAGYEFKMFFDAVPVPGYYAFDNNSTGNKVILTRFNIETFQYQTYNWSGVMQITEVLQNPKRVVGTFNTTGEKTLSGVTFTCQYN